MKNNLKKIILPILKTVLCIFFDKKYIKGKYFDNTYYGYRFSLKSVWVKNFLRIETPKRIPTALTCKLSSEENIIFHPDDINNFQSPGTYFQNFNAKIYLGKGTYIAPNVGIITSNHSVENLDNHQEGKEVIIGERCWVGMNSIILPGVILGNRTIVAAGSVVNKSFEQGNIIIGGTPAKIIKQLD